MLSSVQILRRRRYARVSRRLLDQADLARRREVAKAGGKGLKIGELKLAKWTAGEGK